MAPLGRLRAAADFRRVRERGNFWKSRNIFLNAVSMETPSGGASRIGLIATRRVGGAVQRNRAKRLMREAARQLAGRIEPDWDLVFIAQPGLLASKAGFRDAQSEMEWLLAKARALGPV